MDILNSNIIKYESRPFKSIQEMNEILIENWNNKVKSKDHIYILGDFIFGNGLEANEIIKRLNGRKYLIKGNHDTFLKYKNFDKSLLEWVKDYHLLKYNKMKFILFHYPIHTWDCKHYGSMHLFGHIHSNQSDLVNKLGRAYNVGVDANNYKPISIDKIISKLQK